MSDSEKPQQSVRLDVGPRQVARRVKVAAPVADLFRMVADPHRHGDVDGSGTVHAAVSGPHRLKLGDTFSVKMTFGPVPYRITSKVTSFAENELIEWQHPLGHCWRWEFRAIDAGTTEVTETWDYRQAKTPALLKAVRFEKLNGNGIKRTLDGLAQRHKS